jgi:branched-chain amino acid transport system substrate-binding protein
MTSRFAGLRSTTALATSALALAGFLTSSPAMAADPIKIGVIAEQSAISGVAIINSAKLAADEINEKGGIGGRKIEIIAYDDHSSASDAVRAFQRAVNEDHVNAVVGSYISEVALAMEPWSARLKMPFITTGAASNDISKKVHDDYDHYKYTFHEWLTSAFIAQSVCDSSRDTLVNGFHMKTAVVMSEDAAWTKPLDAGYLDCLPKAGLKVLDHIVFSPDTTDFTPIYSRIESKAPDVMILGISHVGVQPTVQWHSQQVPIAMAGDNAQATSSTFWKDTNGATEGVITSTGAAPGSGNTPKTDPFTDAYTKRFGISPAYSGYATADAVNIIGLAVQKAGSTDPDKMVTALEQTDYVGTLGRIQFYGKNDQFTHAMKYGPDYVTGITIQWQDGKQVVVWPKKLAKGTIRFPSFVKINQASK